ncbi:MAG: aquaporin [Burkholderiales bacterium]|nr:aquaporin [Burkholderiales bacterium]
MSEVVIAPRRSEAIAALREHWPEYLMEAWGLGMFMLSAAVFTTLFEHPGSALHGAVADPVWRRALIGIAMGLTAVGLIYSPWGRRSGAHLNPAVTLTFWRLGKMAGWDAFFYAIAQCSGGLAGVVLAFALLGETFAEPPVTFVITTPGVQGVAVAFAAEVTISLLLMSAVLAISNSDAWMRWTGVAAGVLVASFILVEAPLSGMSMNPARSLASALPAGRFDAFWIYCVAPPLGMLLAAELRRRLIPASEVHCAKIDHDPGVRCIHCGHEPVRGSR